MFNFLKRKPKDGDVRYVAGQFQVYRDRISDWYCIDEAITGKVERTVKKLLCEHKALSYTGCFCHVAGKDNAMAEFKCNDCGKQLWVPCEYPVDRKGILTPKQRKALIDLGVIKKPELKKKKT